MEDTLNENNNNGGLYIDMVIIIMITFYYSIIVILASILLKENVIKYWKYILNDHLFSLRFAHLYVSEVQLGIGFIYI